jgi:hypothetical protein
LRRAAEDFEVWPAHWGWNAGERTERKGGGIALRRMTGTRAALACQRLATVCVVGGLLVLSPATAWATFTGKRSAAVSVGSATLAAPASLTVTVTCPHGNGHGVGNQGSATATFPNVLLASSYQVVLTPPTGGSTTQTTASGSTGATFTLTATGTSVVSVTSLRQSWTSAPITRSFTC